MTTTQLTIAPQPSGALAHIRGVHGWHAEAVQRYSWVWPLMRAAGIERVRIDHCLNDAVDMRAVIETLLAADLAPLLCLDGNPDEGPLDHEDNVYATLACFADDFISVAATTPLEYCRNPPEQFPTQREYFGRCAATMAGLVRAEAYAGITWDIGGPSFSPGAYPGWFTSYTKHLVRGQIRQDYAAYHWYGEDISHRPPTYDLTGALRMTEFNMDGTGTDPRLDTNEGAIWLFNTMLHADPATEYYITGAWGQAIGGDADGRGRLGLVTVDGTRTKRPQYWATFMWNKLGNQRFDVLGLPDGVGAAADEARRLLVWNGGTEEYVLDYGEGYSWYFLGPEGCTGKMYSSAPDGGPVLWPMTAALLLPAPYAA